MDHQSSEMDRVDTERLDDNAESAPLTNYASEGKTPSTGSFSKKTTVKR